MWKQILKILILTTIVAVLIFVGGAVGTVIGWLFGAIYLPVKIFSMIKENFDCGSIGGDEI
jgi:hypothetical protein